MTNEIIILDAPDQIKFYQLAVWKAALKLECKGMTRRGRSVYALVKEQLGFKGSKEKVLAQLEAHIEKLKQQ